MPDSDAEFSGISQKRGSGKLDRRAARTRAALHKAFNHLFVALPSSQLRTSAIIELAGVSRATFYDHYSSVDDLFLDALRRPLVTLADAAVGKLNREQLSFVFTHFWENRSRGRKILSGRLEERARVLLTVMIEERLGDLNSEVRPIAACTLASVAFGLITPWLDGRLPRSTETMAALMLDISAGVLVAITTSKAD